MAFDLDDEELKATRILNKVEKTADMMFEELGYEKQNNPEKEIKYIKNEYHIIRFWKPSRKIIKQDEQGLLYMGISMQELTAINKKVQELGWIHEREEKENGQ